jgi:hypothetical protein
MITIIPFLYPKYSSILFPYKKSTGGQTMQVERIFNNESAITLESILQSIIIEKIDIIIANSYAKNKVNSTASSDEKGEEVA